MYKTNDYIKNGFIPAGNELQDDKIHIFNLFEMSYAIRVNMDDYPDNQHRIFLFLERLEAIAREAQGGFVDSEYKFFTTLKPKQVKDWFRKQFNPDVLVFEGFDF